jgi:Uma2 family endonuclease
MALQLERHPISLEEFERMVDAGVFGEDTRIELIRREIIEMAPIGFPHEMCVARLSGLLTRLVGERALVWPQNNSIRLPGNSRPQPDLTLLKWRDDYTRDKPPTAKDVLVIIEVSETSLVYDRTVKGPLYAEAGIPEYWIVNLRAEVVEVSTNPVAGKYESVKRAKRGETLALPGELEGAIAVGEILGGMGKA